MNKSVRALLPLAFALSLPAAFAQNPAPAGKLWLCEGGPAGNAQTRYVALFRGADSSYPAAVNYGHQFCDHIARTGSFGKKRVLCDCNMAANDALAHQWLEHDLKDPHEHYRKIDWKPRAASAKNAS